jgi:hypothetical protein
VQKTRLKEFKSVLADFKTVSTLTLKASVLAPFANLWARIGPPPTVIVAVLASITEIIILTAVFQASHRVSVSRVARAMKTAALLFFATAAISFALNQSFIVLGGKNQQRIITGFQVRTNVTELIRRSQYGSTTDAFHDGADQPDHVWTSGSILCMQIVLPLLWIASFGFLAAYLALFVIADRKRQAT